jgi:cyclophilin family peptidyl-prolyl cis-trans isomerase
VVLAIAFASPGCQKRESTGDGARSEAAAPAPPPDVPANLAKAEDGRRARDVPADAQRSADVGVRRLAARAFARILDPDDGPLLRALEDDDAEVAAWGAYGLGESCKGGTEGHVRAIAARLVTLEATGAAPAVSVALRALGRCGGDAAEQTLRTWMRSGASGGAAAALGLGDAVALRGTISLETAGALVDAALNGGLPGGRPPIAAALYPFSRVDGSAYEGLTPRLLEAIRAALGRAGPERIFAVRALGRLGADDAAPELGKILRSSGFLPQERAEAARGLARLHKPGQIALADSLAALVPDRVDRVGGDDVGVLLAALRAVADDLPKTAEAALWTVARLEPPFGAAAPVLRRASALRCAAAERLARGAWESDVLQGCDVADGEAGASARIASLDRGSLTHARRAVWLTLSRSPRPRVREAALELVGRHPELGDEGRAALAEALASGSPGVVAVAADMIQAHPERVFVLAESERRAALDPLAPPPSPTPAREIDSAVAKGLRAALNHAWTADLVETRVALVDAALAAGLPEGLAFARAACADANVTVRARAAKALAASGEKDVRCPPAEAPDAGPGQTAERLTTPLRIALDTDAGPLGLRLDPVAAPLATARVTALARSGFYTGVVVHRVVEGFVVQLGDRGGDGYGGSGDTLRCETAPLPFEPLDVGLALAGRDTGSSQIFVTLARHPHLDGEYPWLGRADGDWNAVVEGDVVRAVRVEE